MNDNDNQVSQSSIHVVDQKQEEFISGTRDDLEQESSNFQSKVQGQQQKVEPRKRYNLTPSDSQNEQD